MNRNVNLPEVNVSRVNAADTKTQNLKTLAN